MMRSKTPVSALPLVVGAALSFAVVQQALADNLEVTPSGVGINTASPTAALDVRSSKAVSTDDDFALTSTNQGKAKFTFTTAGSLPNGAAFNYNGNALSPGGLFAINLMESDGTFGGAELRLNGAGNLVVTGTISSSSSRTVKDQIGAVDVHQVLASIADLPIARWNYKEDETVAHIGPMAEDFHAAFAVGSDDKHISMVDSDGVALAAIQALNQNQKSSEGQVAALKRQLEEKTQSLEALRHVADEQREAISALQARLDALEQSLTK